MLVVSAYDKLPTCIIINSLQYKQTKYDTHNPFPEKTFC